MRGAQSVVQRSPNMWTLISLGTGAAFLYSVVATLAPGVFPASFISMGRVAVYFEAAVVIISLTLFGQLLELKARSKTSAAIKSLLGLSPKMARRLQPDGSEEDIPLAEVHESKPGFEVAVGVNGFGEDEVLRLAARLDQGSEHALAAAIVNAARERKLSLEKPRTSIPRQASA